MEYKRLTDKDWHKEKFYGHSDCERTILKRLWDLENKIEQGTLVELPCKVGCKVYLVDYNSWYSEHCGQCEHDHSGFREYYCDLGYEVYVNALDLIKGNRICPKFKLEVFEIDFTFDFYVRHKNEFGVTYYLTREEAEKKLKELKND